MIGPFWNWWDTQDKVLVVLFCGSVILFLYYSILWWMFGRDPERGPVVPIYEPPGRLPAASMRFLWRMEFDMMVFATALYELARKGYLTIDGGKYGKYVLRKGNAPGTDISVLEKRVLHQLFCDIPELKICEGESQRSVYEAYKALQVRLRASVMRPYFRHYEEFVWFGLGIIGFVAVLSIAVLPKEAHFMGLFGPGFFLFLFGFLVPALPVSLYERLSRDRANRTWRALLLILLALLAMVGVGVFELLRNTSPSEAKEGVEYLLRGINSWAFVFLLGYGVMHGTFERLIPTVSSEGQKLRDEIEGFRLYLETTEKGRHENPNAPNPEAAWEGDLEPYIMALGVGHTWGENLSEALSSALTGAEKQHEHGAVYQSLFGDIRSARCGPPDI